MLNVNAKKFKIKISPLKYLFLETNYELGKYCLRSTKNSDFALKSCTRTIDLMIKAYGYDVSSSQ